MVQSRNLLIVSTDISIITLLASRIRSTKGLPGRKGNSSKFLHVRARGSRFFFAEIAMDERGGAPYPARPLRKDLHSSLIVGTGEFKVQTERRPAIGRDPATGAPPGARAARGDWPSRRRCHMTKLRGMTGRLTTADRGFCNMAAK